MKKQPDVKAHSQAKQPQSPPAKVSIRPLPTGVRGLDDILGGGIPEFSFNIIAGTPGCGKTTLAHQIVFANATPEKPALYFTVLGEPALKMLRYQQQYTFFDASKMDRAVRFINLADIVLEQTLDKVLEEIIRQVSSSNPSVVVVDSFRTVVRQATLASAEVELQVFIQRLAQFLTSWQATTFLVGEYDPAEVRDNPLFTMADGLLWLSQMVERNSAVRKMQIMKLRGQASAPGLHAFRISDGGLHIFPRMSEPGKRKAKGKGRLSIGVPELDKMMGGGIHEGDSLLVAGPSGTGKSILATHFIAAGLSKGETAVMAIFEDHPRGYTERAGSLTLDLQKPHDEGRLEILYLRPLDLSVDETMQEILDAVRRIDAKRLVIDSLAGLEMALAPGFRTDFRESLYRMIGELTSAGVTIVSTVEVEDNFTSLQFSNHAVSFLTDDIIRMRYVEIEGQLRKMIMVLKMRGGDHSKDIREYIISKKGMEVQPLPAAYAKLTTGLPKKRSEPAPSSNRAASKGRK